MKHESNPIVRFRSSTTNSRKAAINAFCAQCMGCTDDDINEGFSRMIRECTAPKCALYTFRPYQGDKK